MYLLRGHKKEKKRKKERTSTSQTVTPQCRPGHVPNHDFIIRKTICLTTYQTYFAEAKYPKGGLRQ